MANKLNIILYCFCFFSICFIQICMYIKRYIKTVVSRVVRTPYLGRGEVYDVDDNSNNSDTYETVLSFND